MKHYKVLFKGKYIAKAFDKESANVLIKIVAKESATEINDYSIEEIKTDPFIFISVDSDLYKIKESLYISLKNKYKDASKNDNDHVGFLQEIETKAKYLGYLHCYGY